MKARVFYNVCNQKPALLKQQGLTLVELVISIVVISIALTALLSSFSGSVGRSANPMLQNKASLLAQAYLDEILAMRFQENSPLAGGAVPGCSVNGSEAGESGRELFDDVDDYHGLSQQAAFLDGTVAENYSGYQVAVSVSCQDQSGAATTASKLIVLTISAPAGQVLRFSALRGNF